MAAVLRTNSDIVFPCAFHVVWCPKFRRRVRGGRIEERFKQIIGEVIEDKGGAWPVELDVLPDQVHLLVEVDPRFGIHKPVKAIQGRSSRVPRQELPSVRSKLATLRTNSCFGATAGGAPPDVVKRYVDNQQNR